MSAYYFVCRGEDSASIVVYPRQLVAYMNTPIRLLIALSAVTWISWAAAAQTRVIINLSEQTAYLVEKGRVTLVSPIASGKSGWSTPTGNFDIFNKDIDHRSRSFGSVIDALVIGERQRNICLISNLPSR